MLAYCSLKWLLYHKPSWERWILLSLRVFNHYPTHNHTKWNIVPFHLSPFPSKLRLIHDLALWVILLTLASYLWYSLSMFPVTNWEARNNRNLFPCGSRGWKSEFKVLAWPSSHQRPREESGPDLSLSFWWWQEIPGVPWFIAVSLQPLPLS